MIKKIVTFILLILFFILGWFARSYLNKNSTPLKNSILITQKPLEKYTIENLSKANIKPGKLFVKELLSENNKYSSYLFEFQFNPDLDGKTIKQTTAMINIPKKENLNSYLYTPVLLMIRGFVDQKMYQTGMGTKNAANYFSENGFITIAPDFLGYSSSDKEADNIFESRFQTYVTVISLLNTIENLPKNPELISGIPYNSLQLSDKPLSISIWSHSNGGQIALTTLAITGRYYPTILWAPVTKSFPYSILYYTDEADDGGRFLRKNLSEFESLYNTDDYSLSNYLDRINSPIQLNQGTADEEVPQIWSDEFVSSLKHKNKEIEYLKYVGADHNMRPVWNEVVENNLVFLKSHLKVKVESR